MLIASREGPRRLGNSHAGNRHEVGEQLACLIREIAREFAQRPRARALVPVPTDRMKRTNYLARAALGEVRFQMVVGNEHAEIETIGLRIREKRRIKERPSLSFI